MLNTTNQLDTTQRSSDEHNLLRFSDGSNLRLTTGEKKGSANR